MRLGEFSVGKGVVWDDDHFARVSRGELALVWRFCSRRIRCRSLSSGDRGVSLRRILLLVSYIGVRNCIDLRRDGGRGSREQEKRGSN